MMGHERIRGQDEARSAGRAGGLRAEDAECRRVAAAGRGTVGKRDRSGGEWPRNKLRGRSACCISSRQLRELPAAAAARPRMPDGS